MSAPAPPAPRRSLLSPAAADDGLSIADLVGLLGLETPADLSDETAGEPADETGDVPADEPAGRAPVDAVALVRSWVRRAAAWGAGPQRSWCAW
ncbi:hypothetical protein ACWKWC_21845 [Geodermatophilus nigrescens]|uniref:hypothetical protein n=1 Tax=Geodermatophilus sp. FMUSA9-8 TaxID=3120155 RepID=UPI00300BC074